MMFVTFAKRIGGVRGGVIGPVFVENVAIAGGAGDDVSPFILLKSAARARRRDLFSFYVVESVDCETLQSQR